MSFELPSLPYAYNALEPHIDAMTMEIHHSKHHNAYVTNLNAALDKHPHLAGKSLEDLVSNPDSLPEDIRTAVRNNGGGHYNHSIFWKVMTPNGGGEPKGDLARAISDTFGDFAAVKYPVTQGFLSWPDCGRSWLILKVGKLTVLS